MNILSNIPLNYLSIILIIVVLIIIILTFRFHKKSMQDPYSERYFKRMHKRDLKKHFRNRKKKGYLNNVDKKK